jgi:hypothetical protein
MLEITGKLTLFSGVFGKELILSRRYTEWKIFLIPDTIPEDSGQQYF